MELPSPTPSPAPRLNRLIPLAVVLALQAALLGGSTAGWSRGLTVALIGLALAVRPPEKWPLGRWGAAGLLALFLWNWLPFLPLSWVGREPLWRNLLADYAALPETVSPQPWLTAEGNVLFLAGLGAFCWFAGFRWSGSTQRQAIRFLAAGISTLAGLCLLLHVLHLEPLIWHSDRHFGPFPSRNHTGNLLALGGVLAAAAAVRDFLQKRFRGWWILAGVFVVAAALAVNGSRGGAMAFASGLLALFTVLALDRRTRWMGATGTAVLILSAAAAIVSNGRFSESSTHALGFRTAVYEDALRMMVFHEPWTGLGAGNFEPVFAFYRERAVAPARLIHPESDWVWSVTTMGFAGTALLGALLAAALVKATASLRGHDRQLEIGAAAALGGWLLHSLIDVPGHLFGTLLPALLLVALLLGGSRVATCPRWIRLGFRSCGGLLVIAGLYLVLSAAPGSLMPGGSGAAHALASARAAENAGQPDAALASTDLGLQSAPLSWPLQFRRGAALAALGQTEDAQASFKAAKLLQPGRAIIPEMEGFCWLTSEPTLALLAWREALALDPLGRRDLFRRMLEATRPLPALQPELREIARSSPALFTVYVEQANPAELEFEIALLRETDPELAEFTLWELHQLFAHWWPRDPARVAEIIRSQPRWLAAGWSLLAEEHARRGELKEAADLAHTFAPPPASPDRLYPEAERAWKAQDWAAAWNAYQRYIKIPRRAE